MALLIVGILTWALAHLFVSAARPTRDGFVARFGEGPYKGLFSLVIVASIVMMVFGWQASAFVEVWSPPTWTRHVAALLMIPALILFFSARAPNNFRRAIRHPQLTGVKVWAVAHLLANGDLASILLFGGMLAWAVAEVIVINRRAGAWVKPPAVEGPKQFMSIGIGLVAYVLFVAGLHALLFGVAPFG